MGSGPLRPLTCALLWACLALTACTVAEPAQTNPNGQLVGLVAATHTAGQTFRARYAGLSGVSVQIATFARVNHGRITLHLRTAPDASASPVVSGTRDLRTVSVDAEQLQDNAFQLFSFEPLPDSTGQRYAFVLSSDAPPEQAVSVWQGAGVNYTDGNAYYDDAPLDTQLMFTLDYATVPSAVGIAREALGALPAALALAAFFTLPGLALLAWSGLSAPAQWDWRVALTLAPGVTSALIPLVFLAAHLIHLPLGAWAAWGLCVLGALGTVLAVVRGHVPRPRLTWRASDLALIAIGLVLVGVRLWSVRLVSVPLWVDGQQHGAIVARMSAAGGLFDDWAPYAPYSTFTQQFGFHAGAVLVQWLTGTDPQRAAVLAGQLYNALAVLTLYPLAVRLAGTHRAGVFAVLCAGLLTPVPMEYLNWGRYPQIAGQTVLPVALWAWMALLARPPDAPTRVRWGAALLVGVTATGMLLCSYRMVHFYGMFVVVWLLACAWQARWSWATWRMLFLQSILPAAGIALALWLPWLVIVGGGGLPDVVAGTLTGTPRWERVRTELMSDLWLKIPAYGPGWLAGLAFAGWLWALVRRRWELVAFGVWIALMPLILVGRLVRLPTSAFFQGFSLLIALYIPIALLVGWLASELMRLIAQEAPRAVRPLALCVFGAALIWGLPARAATLDEVHWAMVTTPDLAAFAWVRANTPADAYFAVNMRDYMNRTGLHGMDAGWWLPMLAGRAVTAPPFYASSGERESVPGYNAGLYALFDALRAAPPPAPAGVAALCAAHITHIYIGQQHGATGYVEPAVRFDAQALNADPAFTAVYHTDRVWIFALNPAACVAGQP